MTITIKQEPNIELTQDEFNKFKRSYEATYMFYSGEPPTFETFVKRHKDYEKMNDILSKKSPIFP
jgi:hypothetical protein